MASISKSHKQLLCSTLVGIFILATIAATLALENVDLSVSLGGLCDHANPFRDSCIAIISEVSRSSKNASLLESVLLDSSSRVDEALHKAKFLGFKVSGGRDQLAVATCVEMLHSSKHRLSQSISALRRLESDAGAFFDAHTWLSSVLTNHMTCVEEIEGEPKGSIEAELNELIIRARTALAVFVKSYSPPVALKMVDEFPSWATRRDRKLMQLSGKNIAADAVVANDGSGQYKKVMDAVYAAPTNCPARYIIYVKKGVYKENVQIGNSLKNIMLVGDGMDSTIITGCLNVIDGSTTYNSATVAAVGDSFMAQDIWFQNTAGAEKHQAVALRVGADRSVINRCRIDAYQDTLYAHSNRQFYQDSYITGTVDFIFGNAAVVFQNCQLVSRKPMAAQANMVTAQGKTDKNQNTGTSIQNCTIVASADLQPVAKSIKSYLGRPWKKYSTTVVMESYIGDCIDPAGWSVWDGSFALNTLNYGEYKNRGPGSNAAKRVKWAGYHPTMKQAEATRFTVRNLIQGNLWLPSTDVAFYDDLSF